MRIIIELDNGQPEPQVLVNNTGSDQSAVNPTASNGMAINAGSPKINSDQTPAMPDMQNKDDAEMPAAGGDVATTNAGEAPVH